MKSTIYWQRVFSVFLILGMLFSFLQPASAQVEEPLEPAKAAPQIQIEQELLSQFESEESAGYLIYFNDRPDLSAAYSMTWEERGWYVYETLQAAAERAQAGVKEYLDGQKVEYQSFWIDNIIVVESSSRAAFNGLMEFPEIESIKARRQPMLVEPVEEIPLSVLTMAIEPNLLWVGADQVWSEGIDGSGIVVANIDTGVRYTHQALASQYRGNLGGGSYDHNYNWWDPYVGSTAPVDVHNHGSHTMGTMLGDDGGANQIGMAPGAQWMACKGFNPSATDAGLLSCGQFIAAPWNLSGSDPNPDMRPHIVNNSWGDCQQTYDSWYAGVINNWHAGGIYPVFSNGNSSNCGYPSPPGLNTVGNPARSGNVTGVGSTGRNNGIYATYSNWGPTDNPDTINPGSKDGVVYDTMKPQVLAPGTNRSAYKDSDTAYGDMSGTSMAGPHVAGLVALMWNAAPCLVGDYPTTETIIEQTANPIPYASGGSPAPPPDNVPNYATGWGEIRAVPAVDMALGMCGDSELEGVVSDSVSGDPIEGAAVVAENDEETRTTITDENGYYHFSLFAGLYDVTASAFGYYTATAYDVEIVEGEVTVLNIELDPAPSALIEGTVVDSATGWPLYSMITVDGVDGAPISPFWTDPISGEFSLELPEGGDYAFTATAWIAGYLPGGVVVEDLSGPTVIVIELDADMVACIAPGYTPGSGTGDFYDFESDDGGFVSSNDWEWGTYNWAGTCATSYPPPGAHSGTNMWGTVLNNCYNNLGDTSTLSFSADLTGQTSALLQWWDWYDVFETFDHGEVYVNDTLVYDRATSYIIPTAWEQHQVDLTPFVGGIADIEFRMFASTVVERAGWYIDDVLVGEPSCTPQPGGLVAGQVLDGMTGDPLTGAIVSNEDGFSAVASTTMDPEVNDAFYTVFSPPGLKTFTASKPNYGSTEADIDVLEGSTVEHDFLITPGYLVPDPETVSVSVEQGSVAASELLLQNIGGSPLSFTIKEKNLGFSPELLAGEQILVVRYETAQADPMQAVLASLGITYLGVTDTVFRTIPVEELLGYEAVFYLGNAPTLSHPKLIEYLDAGGSLYISDNDLGFSRGSTVFYQDYLQATYNVDNAGNAVVGEGLMSGLNLSLTDPYPDGYTVREDGVRIFKYAANDYAGGSTIERMGYRAIYLAFDFHRITETDGRIDLVQRALSFLVSGDAPWLDIDPTEGEIDAGASETVDLTFTTFMLSEPGLYQAELLINDDTPYGQTIVPVDLSLLPSATAGILQGTVTGLGYCDGDPAPLADADILIEYGAGLSWTGKADSSGSFQFWFDEAYSPLTVTASAEGYLAETVFDVAISAGETTTLVFDLRLDAPCLGADPDALSETLNLGESTTTYLTLTNTGAAPLDFELVEEDLGFLPEGDSSQILLAVPWLSEDPVDGIVPEDGGELVVAVTFDADQVTLPGTYLANLRVVSNDPVNANFPVPITMTVTTPTNYGELTGTVTGLGYCDENPAPLAGAVVTVTSDTGGPWETTTDDQGFYTFFLSEDASPLTVTVTHPQHLPEQETGVVIVGGEVTVVDFELRWLEPCISVEPEALSETLNLGESTTAYLTLTNTGAAPLDFVLVEEDLGFLPEGDSSQILLAVPWLSEDPVDGTVPEDGGELVVAVTFDADQVTLPGTYSANLRVVSNDPVNANFPVPITMTVTTPTNYGELTGTVTGLGYCDENPAPLAGALVTVTSDTGGPWETTTDDQGFYTFFLSEDASPLTVTVTHPQHLPEQETGVVIVGGEVTVVDFELRWLEPCISVEPEAFQVDLELGSQLTETMSILNSGTVTLTFEIKEKDLGYTPAILEGEEILVVRKDANSATAVQDALTTLGVPFLAVTDAVFQTIPVNELLNYDAVFYIGTTGFSGDPTASETLLIAYLDAGGSLYITDNDLGYYRGSSVFYQSYLQSTYNVDNAGAILNGEDIMAGLTLDVTPDPFPDGFTVGAEGARIFKWAENDYAGGIALERLGYQAIYTSFDFQHIQGLDIRVVVIERILDFLVAGDAVWLIVDPTEGEVAPDGSASVELTFDAAALPEPGFYQALVNVKHNAPAGKVTVPVDMQVTAPATYGKLSGNVLSLGYCNDNPAALEGAEVYIESSLGMTWTLTTDAGGYYQLWLDESHSPLTATASFEGHLDLTFAGVVIEGGLSTEVDFDLILDAPCIEVDPSSIDATLTMGESQTIEMVITNHGAADLDFVIEERDGGMTPPLKVSIPASDGNFPRGNDAHSVERAPRDAVQALEPETSGLSQLLTSAPAFGVNLIGDTFVSLTLDLPGTLNVIKTGVTQNYYAGDFLGWDFSVLYAVDDAVKMLHAIDTATGDATVIGPMTPVTGNTWTGMAGDSTSGTMYAMSVSSDVTTSTLYTVDVSTGAVTIVGSAPGGLIDIAVNAAGEMYALDIISDMLVSVDKSTGANTPIGSIGFNANYAQGMDFDEEADILYLAAYDGTFSRAELRVADTTTGATELIGLLGAGTGVEIDAFGIATAGSSDVPWLSYAPESGTVAANGGTLTVDVTLDTVEISQPGLYMATLRILSNDPGGIFQVPVEMTVIPPAEYGFLEGTVTGLGACDLNPAPIAGAEITIEGSSGEIWTLITNAQGHYGMYLHEDESPLTVSVDAAEHEAGAAYGVVVVGSENTIVDFDLRWLVPCLSVDPASFAVEVPIGTSLTQSLLITNDGAAAADFVLSDVDQGSDESVTSAGAGPVRKNVRVSGLNETGAAAGEPIIGPAAGGPLPDDIGDEWETMAPLPSPRVFNAVIADTNGYIYSIGGTSDAGGTIPTNSLFRYNTPANAWDTMTAAPAVFDSIDGITISNKIYVPGDDTTSATYVYDIASDSWSSIPHNGGFTGRIQYQVAAIGTDLYVLGGIVGGSASTTEVWKLDTTTETWSPSVPMQKSRTSFAAGAIDGEIYVAGGVLFPGFVPDMTAEKFDGVSWSYIADVPNGGGAYTRWSYNADAVGADGLWLAAGRRDLGWAVLNHAGYYDPATNTWTDSPTIPILNQGRVYVEGDVATDGYFYVIGGRDSAGAIIYGTNERLYVGYAGAEDAPWVSEDPESGTVGADDSFVVEITFTAMPTMTVGVTYFADIRLASNDPVNSLIVIPVSMFVSEPDTYGVLTGVVTGLGYCDTDPNPLSGVEVLVESATGGPWNLVTDANGVYTLYIEEEYSPLTVSVFAEDHEFGYETDVWVTASETTTVDFDLRWLKPCQNVDPASLDFTVAAGHQAEEILTISNLGAADLVWEIEEEAPLAALLLNWSDDFDSYETGSDLHGQGGWKGWFNDPAFGALTSDAEARSVPNSAAILGDSDLVHEYSGYTSGQWIYTAWQFVPTDFTGTSYFIMLNTYNDAGVGLNWSTQVQFVGSSVINTGVSGGSLPMIKGQWVELRVEIDLDADTQSFYYGGDLLYSGTWTDEVSGGGALNIGAVDLFANGASVVYYDDLSLLEPYVEPEVCELIGDIPWLSAAPDSGITPPDGSDDVTVAVDGAEMLPGEIFEANLCVFSNDPVYPLVVVPVIVNVEGIAYGVDLSAEEEALSGAPGETVEYSLTLTNLGNATDTFDLTFEGNLWDVHLPVTSFELDPGESTQVIVHVTIPAEAEDGDMDEVTVTATSQGDPDTFDGVTLTTTALVPAAEYGLEVNWQDSELSGEPGETVAFDATLTNTGNVPDTYDLSFENNLWEVVIVPDEVSLEAGASALVSVMVTIPAEAEDGDWDDVMITVVSQGDPEVWHEAMLKTTAVVIIVGDPPVAGFTFAPAAPVAGEEVSFTNTTTGSEPITYEWTFGDGGSGTAEHPTHVYAEAGSYVVTLTATNAFGEDTHTETIVISAVEPPPPPTYTIFLPIILQ